MSEDVCVEETFRQEFFRGMTDDQLGVLAQHATCRHLGGGDVLFRKDEPAEHFFVVRTGKVALELASPGGVRTIQTLGPGEVVGFSWLIAPHTWEFDAHCVGPTTVVELDGVAVRERCEADRDFGYELLSRFSRQVVKRLQATRVQLLDVYG
ncbi:MAG: Crp/Fnr family transcriptional regulator [Myxococcota bacterium]